MKNCIQILLLLSIFSIVFGCRKDPTPPVMQVSPYGLAVSVNPNQIFEFSIHAYSEETELRNIVITHKPEQGVTTTLKDTVVSGLVSDFFFHYYVSSADELALITFTVFNSKGESGTDHKRLYLNDENQFLEQTEGHTMYSKYSIGNPNAFNIGTSSFYQLPANPDSLLVDLVEFDQSDDDNLSNELTSWSGLEFVKNNSFNYAEATNELAEDSYSSSSPLQIVNNITVGDILITKYDIVDNKYAVIKITGVNDLGDDEQNNYTFSLKK